MPFTHEWFDTKENDDKMMVKGVLVPRRGKNIAKLLRVEKARRLKNEARKRKGIKTKCHQQKVETYGDRTKVLSLLRFDSYLNYLASDLWRAIRKRVMDLHSSECLLCDAIAECVHHMTYTHEVLLGKRLNQLIPLCKACHKKIEFCPDGKKRSMKEMQQAYNRRFERLPEERRNAFKLRVKLANRKKPRCLVKGCTNGSIRQSRFCEVCLNGFNKKRGFLEKVRIAIESIANKSAAPSP